MEAHGGYTFCGVAALVILKKEHLLDLRSLLVSGAAVPSALPVGGRRVPVPAPTPPRPA